MSGLNKKSNSEVAWSMLVEHIKLIKTAPRFADISYRKGFDTGMGITPCDITIKDDVVEGRDSDGVAVILFSKLEFDIYNEHQADEDYLAQVVVYYIHNRLIFSHRVPYGVFLGSLDQDFERDYLEYLSDN